MFFLTDTDDHRLPLRVNGKSDHQYSKNEVKYDLSQTCPHLFVQLNLIRVLFLKYRFKLSIHACSSASRDHSSHNNIFFQASEMIQVT